jgi:hypothetical protein
MTWNRIATPSYNVQGYGTVELQYRELRARWSQEAVEDLRAIHNLDAEAVLTEMLAAELNQEIDQESRDIRGFFRSKKATRFFRKVDWKKEGF